MSRVQTSPSTRPAYAVWVLLLALMLVLAACGAGDEPAAEEEPAAAEEAASADDSDDASADGAMMSSNEAPQLAEMVAAGDLPPLEERIPNDPLVIDLPWIEVGKYGGTLKRTTTRADFRSTSAYMYGHSPLHWEEGGTAVGPGLARAWESNADATEWTFYFREGTRWSDGQPFTVDDILFWWEDMAANPDHPMAMPAWTLVGGQPMTAEKIDDYSIRFTFVSPSPLIERELAAFVNGGISGNFGPYPRHYLEQFHPDYSDAADYEEFTEKQDWWINPDRPVLNAWMPVTLDPGNRLILERNPY